MTKLWLCPKCGTESPRPVDWLPKEEGGRGEPCGGRVKKLRHAGGSPDGPMRMKWGRCLAPMEAVERIAVLRDRAFHLVRQRNVPEFGIAGDLERPRRDTAHPASFKLASKPSKGKDEA